MEKELGDCSCIPNIEVIKLVMKITFEDRLRLPRRISRMIVSFSFLLVWVRNLSEDALLHILRQLLGLEAPNGRSTDAAQMPHRPASLEGGH